MILLQRGQQAVIGVTVTEKSGGGFTHYRFVFTHDVTKVEYTKVLPIHGSYPERIDLFNLDVDAVFSSSDDGFFSYKIFTHAGDPETEDPDSFLVEIGKMKLEGTRIGPVQYQGAQRINITHGR